jgi:hypothetical protein
MQNDPALTLPAHHVSKLAAIAATMESLSFARLVTLAARIDRSKAAAAEARAMTEGRFDAAFDDMGAQLDCMFGLVEAELEKRLA